MSNVTLKGTPVKIAGNIPKVGQTAPDFTLVDMNLKQHSLSEFKGKKILLSINPSLDTSVCLETTKKFNEISKTHPEIDILIITGDLPFAQKRICGLEKVDNIIPLSIIRCPNFAKDYGVLIEDGPLETLPARAVIIIDEAGNVIYSELVEEISNEPNYEKALEALTS